MEFWRKKSFFFSILGFDIVIPRGDMMKMMIIVLNNEDYLDDLLKTFQDFDVGGATIIASQGMNSVLHDLHPEQSSIFASIKVWTESLRSENKTIFLVIEDEKVEPLFEAVERVIGSLDKPGTGIVFTIPVDHVRGFKRIQEGPLR